MSFKLPESLDTKSPKEAIAFCIAYGIQEGILPPKFNMNQEGYQILEQAVTSIWNEENINVINQVMIAFIAGYATGAQQVEYKKDGQ